MIVKSSFAIHSKSGQASGSLTYISREGAFGNGPTPVYDREGYVINNEGLREIGQEIRNAEMERRLIFSPQDPYLSKEDLSIMTRDVIERYQTEDSKSFDYIFAIHDHNVRTHAHILAWGDKDDLKMDKEDLAIIRDKASELEIEQERTFDIEMTKDHSFESEKSEDYKHDDSDAAMAI